VRQLAPEPPETDISGDPDAEDALPEPDSDDP
jgi:hypothetical protein